MTGRLTKVAIRFPRMRRVYRDRFPLPSEQPDWPSILAEDWHDWRAALAAVGSDAPRVALMSSPAAPAATVVDSTLAIALTLRGAHVDVVLCDEVLPACMNCMLGSFHSDGALLRHGPQVSRCPDCYAPAKTMFDALGVPAVPYATYLGADTVRDAARLARSLPAHAIRDYVVDGVAVGEHAHAGAIRFYLAEYDRERRGEEVLRRYFEASLITHTVFRAAFRDLQTNVASFHHGIYIPQGVVGEVARASDVRVVNWMRGYRDRTFIFSHDDTYHHTLMAEPTTSWEHMQWDDVLERETLEYLRSRWHGGRDWVSFNRDPIGDIREIETELGIDLGRPTVALLTNVAWDAQLHYPANAFADMFDWVLATVQHFEHRPELQLVIRVHPAEVRGALPSRQPVLEELRRRYGVLPANVHVVAPESRISTYALAMASDAALVYGTKMGVELTALGIPVIVAGEAWIRNKGLTADANSPEEYESLLAALPSGRRLDEATVARARRYAFHFFFRRMIPFPSVRPTAQGQSSPYEVATTRLADLAPGADPGLDLVCDGILVGSPFVYPAELRGATVE